MKNLKLVLFSFIAFCIVACGDDDSSTSQNDTPVIDFDVAAIIALPANTDITSMVTFNGQPASTYTTELETNDRLTITRPVSLSTSDDLLYVSIAVEDANDFFAVGIDPTSLISDDGFFQLVVPAGEAAGYYNNINGVPTYIIEAINQDQTLDIDYKYTLEVTINRGGTDFGPYIIDPKIRIKARN